MPLVEVLDLVEVALANRYRGEGDGKEVGSGTFYGEVYESTWLICDTCSAGIIVPGHPVVRISRKLFTRNIQASQFGDYLCLTIGQIGSRYGRPWSDGLDLYDQGQEDTNLSAFVEPFLYSHVMILNDETLKTQLKEIGTAAKSGKRDRGRPRAQEGFAAAYVKMFPDGHRGLTKKEAIDKVHKAKGPQVSIRTFDRAMDQIRADKLRKPGT